MQLRDAAGNDVSESGVAVTASIASGGGTLGGTVTAATGASGLASFTDLAITGTAGNRTLGFTSGTLTAATSNIINVTPPPPEELQNAQPVTGLSGAQESKRHFRLAVPSGMSELRVTTSGGSGDVDLYVRFGAQATEFNRDCSSLSTTNSELCVLQNPAAGDWFIMLRGFSAYSGVTLIATATHLGLQNNVPVGVDGAQGTEQHFALLVPTGTQGLRVTTTGGTGDADLYVRFGTPPTQTAYDCRPFTSGSAEQCSFLNPAAGEWFVMVRGFTSFSGVNLRANYASDADFLDVRRHTSSALSTTEADRIILDITVVLQTNDGSGDLACDVVVLKQGPVLPFSTGSGILNNQAQLAEVFNLPGNVKVVNEVNFCGGVFKTTFIGCGQTPGSSFIVERFTANQEGILWAHELGHNKGLPHRNGPNLLMNAFIGPTSNRINGTECTAFRN